MHVFVREYTRKIQPATIFGLQKLRSSNRGVKTRFAYGYSQGLLWADRWTFWVSKHVWYHCPRWNHSLGLSRHCVRGPFQFFRRGIFCRCRNRITQFIIEQ